MEDQFTLKAYGDTVRVNNLEAADGVWLELWEYTDDRRSILVRLNGAEATRLANALTGVSQ